MKNEEGEREYIPVCEDLHDFLRIVEDVLYSDTFSERPPQEKLTILERAYTHACEVGAFRSYSYNVIADAELRDEDL